MSISDIKRAVIPAAAARPQQQDLSNKPHPSSIVDDADAQDEPTHQQGTFEQDLEEAESGGVFDGYDALGHKTPLGFGLGVMGVIDDLVEDTLPRHMDIHELNIRLKLKRQEDTRLLPPPRID